MKLEMNKRYLSPLIQICDNCYKTDICWIIKEDKNVYKVCDRCGYQEKVGLVNKNTLEKLGYKVV